MARFPKDLFLQQQGKFNRTIRGLELVIPEGRGYFLMKMTGCSSEIFENTPKRHQILILWAWPQIHLHP